jgi:aspartyl-tRNA(Asn)/glutamyl-tRNA(Gln) amidotransferase subunit A
MIDTAVEAVRAMRGGRLSPVELTTELLARIDATEPALNAYLTVTADAALERARQLAAARSSAAPAQAGPLFGLPVGIKDIIDTAGVRTTYGSPRFADQIPSADALAVQRWKQAGVVILGKHATHELAWGGRTDSAHYGPTHNPYRHGHIPGGSSGGSAASVAVGSSLGALGSDTAGSVRIPAALSGCVGFKPSRGRIPLRGVLPLARSLDHLGVLARTVEDAALLAASLVDGAPDGATGLGAEGAADRTEPIRVGWLGGWFDAVLAPEVREVMDRCRAALGDAGFRIEPVPIADEPRLPAAILERIVQEAGELHRDDFAADPTGFGTDVAELLRRPERTDEVQAADEQAVSRLANQLLAALGDHDVLISATVPITAPAIGAMVVPIDGRPWPIELLLTRLTSIFNAIGAPAVSVPAGLADGLPVGLQVVGGVGQDDRVLTVARAIECQLGRLPVPELAAAPGDPRP